MTTTSLATIARERFAFNTFAVTAAEEPFRDVSQEMNCSFHRFNDAFFGSTLVEPHITVGTTPPKSIAFCKRLTDWGAKLQITFNDKVVFGGSRIVVNPWPADGNRNFCRDVLLHEMIHQYHFEITGHTEPGYRGHGPRFAEVCNRIGAELDLPRVIARRRGAKDKGKPVCAHWPQNVRPAGYYAPDILVAGRAEAPLPFARPKHIPSWVTIFESFLALIEEGRIRELKRTLESELRRYRDDNRATSPLGDS